MELVAFAPEEEVGFEALLVAVCQLLPHTAVAPFEPWLQWIVSGFVIPGAPPSLLQDGSGPLGFEPEGSGAECVGPSSLVLDSSAGFFV